MKKQVWRVGKRGALALSAGTIGFLSLPVHAQSSVTLYGIISTAVGYVSNQNGKSLVGMFSGPLQPPRWGLKGREDLGGGTAAIFTLENGFSIANGALGQGGKEFGRQAYVGLDNERFGSITLGRQYDEMSQQLYWSEAATVFATYFAAHVGDFDNIFNNTRFNNSVRYASSSIDGLTFAGQYAFSNSTTGFSDNSGYSFGVNYARGPLKVGAAMVEMLRPASTNASGAINDSYGYTSPFTKSLGQANVDSQRNISVAASYDFGWINANLSYSNALFNYVDRTGLRLQNVEAMVYHRFAPVLLAGVGYDYTFGEYSAGRAIHYNQVNAGIVYSLSKRTDLLAAAVFQRAGGGAQYAQLYNSSPSSSKSVTAVVAGIRVKF
ncbi:porin [Paraburkholderia sp.]|uniref:porin n=1 Tax=Paraburkholderia sp. TaxID=1926495 RepID=UPI0039E4DE02